MELSRDGSQVNFCPEEQECFALPESMARVEAYEKATELLNHSRRIRANMAGTFDPRFCLSGDIVMNAFREMVFARNLAAVSRPDTPTHVPLSLQPEHQLQASF